MKGIQLVGTNFPRVRYAFMSKIKPNTEKYIIDNSQDSSKNYKIKLTLNIKNIQRLPYKKILPIHY